jgi:hypothetical protein
LFSPRQPHDIRLPQRDFLVSRFQIVNTMLDVFGERPEQALARRENAKRVFVNAKFDRTVGD